MSVIGRKEELNNTMKDKIQRFSSYLSGYGLTIYYVEQYNAQANDWFTVGDTTTNIQYINSSVDLHNFKVTHKDIIEAK